MEFEDLSEKVEHEARRVAAAFDIKTFESLPSEEWEMEYEGDVGDLRVYWIVDKAELTLTYLSVAYGAGYEAEKTWLMGKASEGWYLQRENTTTSSPQIRDVLSRHMARGLYRLGFKDEAVLTELNSPLSAHEKMELRLTMPREFWPKQWLDEEKR